MNEEAQPTYIERWRAMVSPLVGKGRHVLVVAQPKSGSTALCNILSDLTGWPVEKYADRTVHGYSFSIQKAISVADRDLVIHLHAHPGWPLQTWIEERRMVPTILARDVGQSLVSMYHHKLRGSGTPAEFLRRLPYERGIEQITYQWAHWYIDFQRYWRTRLTAGNAGLWVDCAEMLADPARVACDILAANGITAPREAGEQAARRVLSDAVRSNYHRSSGRLPAHLLEAIGRLEADSSVLSP